MTGRRGHRRTERVVGIRGGYCLNGQSDGRPGRQLVGVYLTLLYLRGNVRRLQNGRIHQCESVTFSCVQTDLVAVADAGGITDRDRIWIQLRNGAHIALLTSRLRLGLTLGPRTNRARHLQVCSHYMLVPLAWRDKASITLLASIWKIFRVLIYLMSFQTRCLCKS